MRASRPGKKKKRYNLEVKGYDEVEKIVNLDFAPEIREKLLEGETEEAEYVIALMPNRLDCLDGMENL